MRQDVVEVTQENDKRTTEDEIEDVKAVEIGIDASCKEHGPAGISKRLLGVRSFLCQTEFYSGLRTALGYFNKSCFETGKKERTKG